MVDTIFGSFPKARQSYNFFLTFHSQIVQIYSQIVQIFLFSSQIVPISPNWSKKVKKKQKTVATNVTTELAPPTSNKYLLPTRKSPFAG